MSKHLRDKKRSATLSTKAKNRKTQKKNFAHLIEALDGQNEIDLKELTGAVADIKLGVNAKRLKKGLPPLV